MKHTNLRMAGRGSLLARLLITGALALTLSPLWAKEKPDLQVDKTPPPRSDGHSYAPVIKRIAPSVVNIYSERTLSGMSFLEDPKFRRFFGEPRRSPDMSVQNLGSGIIVTKDGYILTNNHVVEGADKVQVVLSDGKREFTATIVGTDPQTDVAVLKIEAKDLPAITFGDSDQVEVGDVVFALGNPRGVAQSVSMRIVSGLTRATGILGREGYEDFIQTDAAINRGNSGGPLVDIKGRLIGVNQSILSNTGGSEGVGFAIPVNLARNVMEQLASNGSVQRGYLGVNLQTLTPVLAKSFNIDDGSGALVSDVMEDSPADEAGLQPGDVIVQFDGRKVEDSSNLRLMASQTAPGTKVNLKIVREGKGIERTLTLAQLPGNLASVENSSGPRSLQRDSLEGVGVEDLTREVRRQMNIPNRIEGVLVTEVEEGSNAHRAGLRAGDVIVEIDGAPVPSSSDAIRLSDEATGDQIRLRVWNSQGGMSGLRFLVVDNRKQD